MIIFPLFPFIMIMYVCMCTLYLQFETKAEHYMILKAMGPSCST